MGLEIERAEFLEADYVAFELRLRRCLEALEQLVARPGFGDGPLSVGAEVELNLVDQYERPLPRNRDVLARIADPRVVLELDQFNLELNSTPVALAGEPWSTLGAELAETLAITESAAQPLGAHVVPIGILPTLAADDLERSVLTDSCRYRALSAGIRRLRRSTFPILIEGLDRLELEWDDVTLEGATTSLQVHLRVPHARYAAVYNAAQIATAPALALAANSPLFLGKRLWDETRIALFRQSVDDRPLVQPDDWRPARVSFGHGWVRKGPQELFAESVALHEPLLPHVTAEDPLACIRAGGVPSLSELRLHNGTVWHWNRAVYDSALGGHFRIEMRALPAGPTVRDMMANAAFLVGLTLALASDIERWLVGLTFGHARRNFYEAARRGLSAELLWLTAESRMRPLSASAVVELTLPLARQGLVDAGVTPDEADRHLDVIARRVATGQTGAVWQRQMFEAATRAGDDALAAGCAVMRAYRVASASELPVHAWERP
jgi:gamma-glutamyl:cysteine ligase YbdK (ATP-grasp superfamily)